MQGHGETDGFQQSHVLPGRHTKQGLVLRQVGQTHKRVTTPAAGAPFCNRLSTLLVTSTDKVIVLGYGEHLAVQVLEIHILRVTLQELALEGGKELEVSKEEVLRRRGGGGAEVG